MSTVPEWFYEAAKVLRWLENQRDKTEEYFSPDIVSTLSHIDKKYVLLAIANHGGMLETAGTMVRFNLSWLIQETLKQMVKDGYMTETEPGKYSLTTKGEQYAKLLIETSPEAKARFNALMRGAK